MIITYIVSLFAFLILDGLWILLIAKKFYAEHLGFIFSPTINITPIVFFYPLYALAITYLVVMPALSTHSWVDVLIRGAILGLAAYGAYDLTNHATIAGWPTIVTLVDMGWGVVITASVSFIAYLVGSALL